MTGGADRLRFAMVEDEAFMAELINDMLTSCGADVEVFMLGADLLKHADLPHFKAIILDLSLPDIDGFDMLERLAATALNASILLMSGHAPSVLHAAKLYGHGMGLQMLGALSKPFTRDELLATLGLTR
jgi:two-component system response regulator CiaR